jgi:Raf kinase inhibitor-like YbhB/YbcL family protein
MSLKLTSSAFQDGEKIPDRYSRRGGNCSPPLAWTGTPDGANSLALIMDDPDAPSGTFVHWLMYRIPPAVTQIEDGMPRVGELPNGIRQGRNGFGGVGFDGPQPPSGVHRYYFHLYALDRNPEILAGASRSDLDSIMRGHILGETKLMGRYGK